MNLAFTICSNNYLAQAKILGDSLIEKNPGYTFYIFLVDKKYSKIDYDFFSPHTVIEVEDLYGNEFLALWQKYDIVELNTAVKASVFKYLFSKFENLSCLFYFDPDIMIFEKLECLEIELATSDIILTPHILTPIPIDKFMPGENTFLNFGIYNLGFLGVKRTINVFSFLDWWEERLLKFGFNDPGSGFYVDQLWINLVPILFRNVKILNKYGYNVGPWNLHERCYIIKENESYKMPDSSNLVFYHFSSYSYKTPLVISKYYNRHKFKDVPGLKALYTHYHNLLIENKIQYYSSLKCFYVDARSRVLSKERRNRKMKDNIKVFVPPIIWDTVYNTLSIGKRDEI